MKSQRNYLAYLLLLVLGFIWGGQFLFNATAIAYFSPVTVTAIRVLIGAATLTVAAFFIPEKTSRPHLSSFSTGVLFLIIALLEVVVPLFLIIWGQQRVDSSVTAVLVGSIPIITLILSTFLSKKSYFNVFSAISVLLGFAGIIILIKPSGSAITFHNALYELAIFCGVLSFALSMILFEKLPPGRPIRTVRNILWIAAAPLTIATFTTDKPWTLSWPLAGVGALLILGVAGSGIAYVLYAFLIQSRGPIFTSTTNFIVPLVGVFLGVVVRGEHFEAKEILALILIISALALYEMGLVSQQKTP